MNSNPSERLTTSLEFRIENENEVISHSKQHSSHPGGCTRIPYLHILDNSTCKHGPGELHQKFAKIFGQ